MTKTHDYDKVETRRYLSSGLMGATIAARAAWWCFNSYDPDRREAAAILLDCARICGSSTGAAIFWNHDEAEEQFTPEEMTCEEMRQKHSYQNRWVMEMVNEMKRKEQLIIDTRSRG
jgi:predicted xylose isomerase-like sugar epimerase